MAGTKFKRKEYLSYIDSTDELIESIERFLIAEKNSIDELQNKIALLSVYDNKNSGLDCYIKNKFANQEYKGYDAKFNGNKTNQQTYDRQQSNQILPHKRSYDDDEVVNADEHKRPKNYEAVDERSQQIEKHHQNEIDKFIVKCKYGRYANKEVLPWMEKNARGEDVKTLQDKDFFCIVDVRDLRSLGYWLNTSVIKFAIYSKLIACDKVDSIKYVNNEITSSIFSKGQFLQSANEMLQLDNYKSFISFYQVNGDHWRLIYFHNKTFYVFDPKLERDHEMSVSMNEGQVFNKVLGISMTSRKSRNWLSCWNYDVMPHDIQTDFTSCGVHVIEAAHAIIESYPNVPAYIKLSTTDDLSTQKRLDIGSEIINYGSNAPEQQQPLRQHLEVFENGYGSQRLPPISHFGSGYLNMLNSGLPKDFETRYQASSNDRKPVSNQSFGTDDEIFNDRSLHQDIERNSYEPARFDRSKIKTDFKNYDDLFNFVKDSENDSQMIPVLPAETSDNDNLTVSNVGNNQLLDLPVNNNTYNIDLRPQIQDKLIPVNPPSYEENYSSIFSDMGDHYLQLYTPVVPSKDNNYDIDLTAQSRLRTLSKRDLSFSGKSEVLGKQLLDLPTIPSQNSTDSADSENVRSIDLVFTEGITEILKVLSQDADFWREKNDAGRTQLKRRVFVTADDLNTYDGGSKCRLYEKLFGVFLTQVTTENGSSEICCRLCYPSPLARIHSYKCYGGHFSVNHGVKADGYVCTNCGSKFNETCRLRYHLANNQHCVNSVPVAESKDFDIDLAFQGKNEVLGVQLSDLPTFPPQDSVDMTDSSQVRCIDLIYTEGITELLKVLPQDTDFWRETDSAGNVQLKRKLFLSEGDLHTYDDCCKCKLYEKLHGNFLMRVTEKGYTEMHCKLCFPNPSSHIASYRSYSAHFKKKHGIAAESYFCNTCNSTIKKTGDIRNHFIKHSICAFQKSSAIDQRPTTNHENNLVNYSNQPGNFNREITEGRAADLIFTKNISGVIDLLPRDVKYDYNENKMGFELRVRILVTKDDISSGGLYDKMFGHLLVKKHGDGGVSFYVCRLCNCLPMRDHRSYTLHFRRYHESFVPDATHCLNCERTYAVGFRFKAHFTVSKSCAFTNNKGGEQQKNYELPSVFYKDAPNASFSCEDVRQPSFSYQNIPSPSISHQKIPPPPISYKKIPPPPISYQNIPQPFISYQNIPQPSISYQGAPLKTAARTPDHSTSSLKNIIANKIDFNNRDFYGSGIPSESTNGILKSGSPFALPQLPNELLTIDNNDFISPQSPKWPSLMIETARENDYFLTSNKTDATITDTVPKIIANFNPEPGSFDLIELVYGSVRDFGTLPTNMISRGDNDKTIVTVKVPKNIKDMEEFYGFIYSHMYKYVPGKGYLCNVCNLGEFRSLKGVTLHSSRMHEGNHPERYNCVECGVKAKSPREILRHLNKHHCTLEGENPASADAASPTSASLQPGVDHIELSYSCDVDPTYLPAHVDARKIVENDETVITVEVPKSIELVEELRAIMYENMCERRGKNNLACKICGTEGFSGFRGLFNHVVKMHRGNHPLCLCCPKCDLRTNKTNTFMDHLKTKTHRLGGHGSRKGFKCAECGREFSNRGNLAAHMRKKH